MTNRFLYLLAGAFVLATVPLLTVDARSYKAPPDRAHSAGYGDVVEPVILGDTPTGAAFGGGSGSFAGNPEGAGISSCRQRQSLSRAGKKACPFSIRRCDFHQLGISQGRIAKAVFAAGVLRSSCGRDACGDGFCCFAGYRPGKVSGRNGGQFNR